MALGAVKRALSSFTPHWAVRRGPGSFPFQPFLAQGDEQGEGGQGDEEPADGRAPENADIAVGNEQGAAQIVLKERAEDEGHQKGRFRDVVSAHVHAHQAHAEQYQDVEGVVVDGERAEQADAEDGRKQDHPGALW